MSRIHTQMSVLWDTKCHRVQTLFVIGVTITLVTSCWMRVFSLFPICFSQQLGAINPALLLPPSYKEGRAFGYPPKKLPLFTENPRRVIPGKRASGIRASRKPSPPTPASPIVSRISSPRPYMAGLVQIVEYGEDSKKRINVWRTTH